MLEHHIKRYVCRYCPINSTTLAEAYVHLAEAHPSYPIDIVERDYKSSYQPFVNLHNDAYYEYLKRIKDEPVLGGVKRVHPGTEIKQYIKKEVQLPTTTPQQQSPQKPVVLNSILGMKGTTAAVSAISSLVSVSPIVGAPLDEPLVPIVNQEKGEGMAVAEEDPLRLENEMATMVPAGAVSTGGGQVDSDASSLNFDTLSVSNVR